MWLIIQSTPKVRSPLMGAGKPAMTLLSLGKCRPFFGAIGVLTFSPYQCNDSDYDAKSGTSPLLIGATITVK